MEASLGTLSVSTLGRRVSLDIDRKITQREIILEKEIRGFLS